MVDDEELDASTLRFRIRDLIALTTYVAVVCAAIAYTPLASTIIVIAAVVGIFFYRTKNDLARIVFFTVAGAIIAAIAGDLMLAFGDGPYVFEYPNDLRMLAAAEVALLLPSVYATRTTTRYFPWVLVGNVLGLILAVFVFPLRATDIDNRPLVLGSVVFVTPVTTILASGIGAAIHRFRGRSTRHGRRTQAPSV